MIEVNDSLEQSLLQALGDTDAVDALVETVKLLSPGFEGTPEEFGKAVAEQVKETEPDFKWPGGALGKSRAVKVIAESVALVNGDGNSNSEDGDPDKDQPSPKDGDQGSGQTETEPDKETILVMLNSKIASYGGGLYDFEQELYILGKEPVRVKPTPFILGKIADGELIKVDK